MRKRLLALFLCVCVCLTFPTTLSAEDVSVSAEAAVLMEVTSGEIIYARNRDERLPMASTT